MSSIVATIRLTAPFESICWVTDTTRTARSHQSANNLIPSNTFSVYISLGQGGLVSAMAFEHLLYLLLTTARSSLKSQRELALENLALRQQLAILKRKTKRPKLTNADRAFWVALSRLWTDWQHALILVKPETVIGWHRRGFKLYWTWKSRHRGGRPPIDAQFRTLIRRIATENPTWGAPRVHGELLMLGFEVEDLWRALREAKAHAALDSRLSNRRQRTQGSEFRPLGHLRHHRRSRLATDKVLRNDRLT